MVDAVRATPWGWRALFAAIVLAALVVRLLPLGREAGGWPAPDLVLCLTCAWVLRRPDYVPALLIVAMVLLEDLLLMRPPGLWTALVLVGSEFLRDRAAFSRELTFMAEWMMVTVVMLAMLAAYRLLTALAFLPQVGLGAALAQVVGSILAYPLVVVASRFVFGLRKPATGEVDAFGRRL